MANLIENSALESKVGPKQERNGIILETFGVVALKTIQLSSGLLIPTVKAAANEAPKKPPPMKYQDLPIYECPHLKYYNYESDKYKCPNHDKKLLHEALLPTVKEYRANVTKTCEEIKYEIEDGYREVCWNIRHYERRLLSYIRQPEHRTYNQVFVGASGLVGFWSGRTMSRRLFGAGIGLFLSGSICFPKATDEAVRTMFYSVAKVVVPFSKLLFDPGLELQPRLPCKKDLPKVPPTKPNPHCTPK